MVSILKQRRDEKDLIVRTVALNEFTGCCYVKDSGFCLKTKEIGLAVK